VAPADQLAIVESRLKELESQTDRIDEPAVDVEELGRLAREVTDSIARARLEAAKIEDMSEDARFATVLQENADRLDRADTAVDDAQTQLTDGMLKNDLELIEAGLALAQGALETYAAVVDQISTIQRATATPTPFVPQPTPSNTPTATLRPTRPQALREPSPTPTSIPIELPEPDVSEIPPQLRQAATNFLRAEFDGVVQELNPENMESAKHRAAAHLLKAASNYALYCLDGREDEGLLDRVRTDIDRCRELAPELRPESLFFSPGFVELYRGER
jgi:hypothetical protein